MKRKMKIWVLCFMFLFIENWKNKRKTKSTLIYLTSFVKLSPVEILLFFSSNSQLATIYDWQFLEPIWLGFKIV